MPAGSPADETSGGRVRDGITVFMPLYNEEELLERNALTVLRYLPRFDVPFELILGSNGSTDATPEIGRRLAQAHPEAVFFHLEPRGPGRAFAEAVRRARYSCFICLDADLSFDMKFTDDAVEKLREYDAVVGSKLLGSQKRPLMRIIASGCFIFLTNLLLQMPWRDYSIGAKAYRTEAIRPFLDKVDAQTFYTQQMLFQLRRARARIIEIPVSCEDHRPSKFNLLHEGFYRYGKLFGLWFRSLRG